VCVRVCGVCTCVVCVCVWCMCVYVCVCGAFVFEHAIRMRHIAICVMPRSTIFFLMTRLIQILSSVSL